MAISIDEFLPGQASEFQHNGWDYKISVELDTYASPDHLGTFTDTWEEGAIDHSVLSTAPTRHVREQLRWFVPETIIREHVEAGSTLEDAKRYVWEDYRRADAFGYDWHYVTMIVECGKLGIVLGTGAENIETDVGPEGFHGLLEQVIDCATAAAEDKLKELKELT